MERLTRLYLGRIAMERRDRLAGDIPAADFYLRQLTHMEVLLELGGGGKHLLWLAEGNVPAAPASHEPEPIYATELTERLDARRREAWAAAGEPDRPAPLGNRRQLPHGIMGGPDLKARQALLEDARTRAAEAQRMLEEALGDQVKAMRPEPNEPIA